MPGPRLLDVLWKDLMSCVEKLMEDQLNSLAAPDWAVEDRIRCQGRAEGVAYCIAVLTQSPHPVDINTIKAEAMERWEAEHAVD